MIVAAFYAHREDRWGADYRQCLDLLRASCARFDLPMVVISDRPQWDFPTFQTWLPENLMAAITKGVRDFVVQLGQPALIVGADCLICADPRPVLGDADAVFTVYPFGDCCLNTGAMWVRDARAARFWQQAIVSNPEHWGEDQTALKRALDPVPERVSRREQGKRLGLEVAFVPCQTHNWAPTDINDDMSRSGGLPVVAHFRGMRKKFMAAWFENHLSSAAYFSGSANGRPTNPIGLAGGRGS